MFEQPRVSYDQVDSNARVVLENLIVQLNEYLGQKPPNKVLAKQLLTQAVADVFSLLGQTPATDINPILSQLRVLDDWIDKLDTPVTGKDDGKSEIQRKLAEVDAFWNSVDVNDPYSILDVSIDSSADQIKKAYRKRARQFHPDFGNTDAVLKEELILVFKLINRANQWFEIDEKELYGGRRPKFVGFEREKKVEHGEQGSDAAEQQERRKNIQYDVNLSSVDVADLSEGDYLHVTTENSYYVFQIFIKSSGEIAAKYHSGPATLKNTSGILWESKIELMRSLFIGRANTSWLQQIMVSRNPARKQQMEKPERPRLQFDEPLYGIFVNELHQGDHVHVKTENSYYVFLVYLNARKQLCLEYISGPKSLYGLRGMIDSEFIGVEHRLSVGGVRTSPLKEIQISRSERRKPEMEIKVRSNITYDVWQTSILTGDLQVGDHLHVFTQSGSHYVFEIYAVRNGRVWTRYQSGPMTLAGANGTIDSKNVKVGDRLAIRVEKDAVSRTSNIQKMFVSRSA